MRLASASGLVVVLLAAASCRSAGPMAPGDEAIKAHLAALGVEGKTYVHDLGATTSMFVHDVTSMDGDFLIEDMHGHLTYVDGATLNVRWEYYGLDEPFTHGPSFTPSAVIGMSGGMLHVLTRHAGVPESMPRRVDVIPSAAPVATDSTIYIPSYPTPAGNKTVYAVSTGSGYVGWGARTNGDVIADMAKGGPMAGDTMYFATTNGAIFAYPTSLASAREIEPAWQTHAAAGVRLDLVVDGDDLGVVAEDGRLICLDRITGNARWEAYPPAGEYGESPAQFSESMVFYRRAGSLHAYDRETGAPLWSVAGGRTYVAQRGDRVLVTMDGGDVASVDAASGQVKVTCPMKGVRFPPQTAKDGTVHAITASGLLVAVELGW